MSHQIKSKHFITTHAVRRFAERVLKQDIKTTEQLEKLRLYIADMIESLHPNHTSADKCVLTCKDYDCRIVKEDGRVVTIKGIQDADEDPDFDEKTKSRSQNRKFMMERRIYKNGKKIKRPRTENYSGKN